jgi:hypothetical protein
MSGGGALATSTPGTGGGSTSSTPAMGGKGGGTTVTPTPTYPAAQPYAPATAAAPAMTPSANPNVYNQAAGAYNTALQGPNIGQFMNPYTSEVIGRTGMDMARQAQMQQNTLGAQATKAGAFGGSRHGVAEGTMMGDYGRAFGDMAAQQRQAGFNTALGAAQNQQSMMSQLAGQGFGFGQQLNAQQMGQGNQQQVMMQALIDAAKGQYGGFAGAPEQALALPLAALGASNMGQQTQTNTQQRGLFDYLTLGATVLGGLCWVAREVYGEEDDRWKQFRVWLLGAAPDWLFNAYAKHGEAFAGFVRKVPVLKRVLRPLMDRARRSAGFEA